MMQRRMQISQKQMPCLLMMLAQPAPEANLSEGRVSSLKLIVICCVILSSALADSSS